jgi:uncharacterized protein YndB with AHSA1/START domain
MFRTVMRSPEGQEFPNLGCYLEVVPNERLVWTNALAAGFRPAAASGATGTQGANCHEIVFTAAVCLARHAKGTRYTAHAMHQDSDACKRHEQMGFQDGWGKALEQLVAVVKTF